MLLCDPMTRRERLALHFACAAAAPSLALAACATDSGPTLYGDSYGPPGESDAAAADEAASPDDAALDGDHPDDAAVDGEAPPLCATGTLAVLAGNDSALTAAVRVGGAPWATAALAGAAARSIPALVSTGGGFLAATRSAGDVLQWSAFTTAWSAPQTLGVSGAKGAPELAVQGAKVHLVYAAGAGDAKDFFHGVYDGTWDAANANVGVPPEHSFGTTGAGLAAAGSEIVFAENGSDDGLYVRSFTASWGAAAPVAGAGTLGDQWPAPPRLVATPGTAFDMVLVYVQKTTHRLAFATRATGSAVWTERGVVHDLATTEDRISLVRTAPSALLVAFRGQDGKGYHAQGAITGDGITWTAAAPLGPSAAAVDSPPALAKGICGDDAIAVFATGGAVKATRLRGTAWTAPETVTGASGGRVAVATREP
jgi:hypothetical protein